MIDKDETYSLEEPDQTPLEIAIRLTNIIAHQHKPVVTQPTSCRDPYSKNMCFFRYDTCCEQLRNRGVRQYQSLELGHFQGLIKFREVAVGWIGAILRRGTPQEREILERAIVDNSDPDGLTSNNERNVTTTIQTALMEQEESPDEESNSTGSETDVWRYTQALQDVVPIYEEFPLPGRPPKFGAEVAFLGKNFVRALWHQGPWALKKSASWLWPILPPGPPNRTTVVLSEQLILIKSCKTNTRHKLGELSRGPGHPRVVFQGSLSNL
jgi:hypothetical protein